MLEIFNEFVYDLNRLDNTKKTLVEKGVVEITQFFNKTLIIQFIKETLDIFEEKKQRKDLLMKQTESTPRNMFSISQRVIYESSKLIPDFYNNASLLKFLSTIAQEKIMVLPWEAETYLINGLGKMNDTQGWHCDDYSYALVFVAKGTTEEEGGQLECIPNAFLGRTNTKMSEVLNSVNPHTYFYDSGSFYLMKSDTTLHRVSPLIKEGALRVSVAMSLCNESDLLKEIDHETIYELYGV